MGNCATRARVNHGEALFITWSPNEQQSALVLRLMRNRRNDTMLQGEDDLTESLRQCSAMSHPRVTAAGADVATVQLPLYHTRRKQVARDACAVVAAYMYEVKFKLPWLLGLRACPFCPKCKDEDATYGSPCQDIFGTNSLPM